MDAWNNSSSPFRPSVSAQPLPRPVLAFSEPVQASGEQKSCSDRFGYCPPAIVVYSPCGGTGKTSLVANLGRALARDGEDVVLIDTSVQDNLVHYFGAAKACPGDVQTVCDSRTDTRIRLATLPLACHGPTGEGDGWLRGGLALAAAECDRLIIDLSTASRWLTQQIFRAQPLLLVPMLPDWNAILSLNSVREFLEEAADPGSSPLQPNFVLNQFNPQAPFHRAVLDEFRRRVGSQLLPYVLHRSLDVDEALFRGATVLDYEPEAQLSRDYRALAGWARGTSCCCALSSLA